MCSKIIFFVATVCVVNASVITSNVLNDDASVSKESKQFCNNSDCNRRCINLGWRGGGSCVNNQCVCRISRPFEDDLQSINEVEENEILLESDGPISAPEESARSCNDVACHRDCLRRGFRGGSCRHGVCQCRLMKTAEDDLPIANELEENDSLVNAESKQFCNNHDCNRRCINLGWRGGGSCVNNQCVCRISRPFEDVVATVEESKQFCNNHDCNRRCINLGWRGGGSCVNNQCVCRISRPFEDE
ncbi:uncharacterized protein LOC142974295 isoform X2 [Anticarsia gemmatalis]|uniref:uncharacterized protein LOC142974295 isoform X2 n=1 Tax=Anticarsia gemmatalis TaxID=129554 RepID=UPI003F768038